MWLPCVPNRDKADRCHHAEYVPNETGKKFNPHATIGLAIEAYLKKMLDEPFDVFTFSPAGVSVYQLGNNGTA